MNFLYNFSTYLKPGELELNLISSKTEFTTTTENINQELLYEFFIPISAFTFYNGAHKLSQQESDEMINKILDVKEILSRNPNEQFSYTADTEDDNEYVSYRKKLIKRDKSGIFLKLLK